MISKNGRRFGGRCSVPLESRRRPLVGTALAVIAAIGFALSNTLASLAYEGGSNPLTVAALRFFLPAIVLFTWLRVERISLSLSGRDAWIAILLGVLTAQYTWALLVAIHLIPLALAVLLLYLFPFLTTIILVLFGWDKVSLRATAAIAVAFAGLVMALEPRSGGANFSGLALGFSAALGLALVIVLSSRVFGTGDARPLTLWMAAVAAALLATLCAARSEFQLPHADLGWIGLVGGMVLYGFAMISFYVSVAMIGPVRASLLSYVEPVASALLGIAVLGQILAPVQFAGIALVIAALVAATVR
jgi:drug/metabolite transporter (DMT)-like permease